MDSVSLFLLSFLSSFPPNSRLNCTLFTLYTTVTVEWPEFSGHRLPHWTLKPTVTCFVCPNSPRPLRSLFLLPLSHSHLNALLLLLPQHQPPSTMDSGLSTGTHHRHDGLRERNNVSQSNNNTAVPDAMTATGEVEPKDKAEGNKKAFGRTPGGTGMFSLTCYFHHGLLPVGC